MKKLFVNILIILVGGNSFCHEAQPGPASECDFIKNIAYKNHRDTVIVKATYLGMGAPAESAENLNRLRKTEKIRTEDFEYAVEFSVVNCHTHFYISCSDKAMGSKLYDLPSGKTVYLTCVFFEGMAQTEIKGMPDTKHPFFIINKVQINN